MQKKAKKRVLSIFKKHISLSQQKVFIFLIEKCSNSVKQVTCCRLVFHTFSPK